MGCSAHCVRLTTIRNLCLPLALVGTKRSKRTEKTRSFPEMSPHKVRVIQAPMGVWFSPEYNTQSDSSPTYISNSQGVDTMPC